MTKRGTNGSPPSRPELEKLMSADMRAVTAQSDRIGRHFARQHDVSGNDFHALLHVMVAETAGTPLTMAQLRQRMDVSPAAITYLVDRMIDAGHVRRESDPADRRKAPSHEAKGHGSGARILHAARRTPTRRARRPTRQGPRRRSSRVRCDDHRNVDVRSRTRYPQLEAVDRASGRIQ